MMIESEFAVGSPLLEERLFWSDTNPELLEAEAIDGTRR